MTATKALMKRFTFVVLNIDANINHGVGPGFHQFDTVVVSIL
jgi:hypothetical protein